jgi:hypothetical protein
MGIAELEPRHSPWLLIVVGGGGGGGLATGGRDIVATTHGVVKDRDGQNVVIVIVEDDEMAGLDLKFLAGPPPAAGQVRRAGAVEEDLRGLVAGGTAAHPQ